MAARKLIQDWLADVRTAHHLQDTKWFRRKINKLKEVIERGLFTSSEEHRRCATEMLLLVFPYAMMREDLGTWAAMLEEAASHARDHQKHAIEMRLLSDIGSSHIILARPKYARTIIQMVQREADTKELPDHQLDAYIGLLYLQTITSSATVNPTIVREAISLAQMLQNRRAEAALYQALAFAYIYRGEYQRGLEHCDLALMAWEDLGDDYQQGRLFFGKALAYHSLKEFDKAETFLNRAETWLGKAGVRGPREVGLIAHTRGTIELSRRQLDKAEEHLETALELFERYGERFYIAVALDTLARAQIRNQKCDAAYQNLTRAMGIWNDYQHIYYQAVTAYAFGMLYMRKEDLPQALDWLAESERLCSDVNVPRREELLWCINAARREIEEANIIWD